MVYNSESGFYNPSFPATNNLNTAGLADFETRVRAVFSNIPAGVTLYLSAVPVTFSGGVPSLNGQGQIRARMIASESGAFSPVAATDTLEGIPAVVLPVSGGSAVAVWEVLAANPTMIENADFPVWLSYSTSTVRLGTASVKMELAPFSNVFVASSSAPIPRYVSPATAQPLLSIVPTCPGAPYTVTTVLTGLTMIVDGTAYKSPQSFNWSPGSVHSLNAPTPQTGSAIRWVFNAWSDSGLPTHSVTVPATPITYTATYKTQYLLTKSAIPVSGGSVFANPASVDGYYDSGATVQLTAVPAGGYVFASFAGDLSGSANPQSTVLNGPRVVTANFMAPGSQVPVPLAASPPFGSAAGQTFTFTFADPDGYQDLDVVNILINNFLDGNNSCYLADSRPLNVLYLVNDAGNALLPGLVLSGSGGLANGQCGVNAAGSSVSGTGNTLTLKLNMSFNPTFGGSKVAYMAARDVAAHNSGWHALGVWGVPGSPGTNPSVSGLSPARVSGVDQALTLTFSDSTGASNLGVINVLINSALDGNNSCYIAYSRPLNVLYLVNDAGNALLPGMVLNGAGSLSNSQCTINGSGTNATVNGETLTLTLNMSMSNNYIGDRIVYAAALSQSEVISGWQSIGTWSIR